MERDGELGGRVGGLGVTRSLGSAPAGIISLPLAFLNS